MDLFAQFLYLCFGKITALIFNSNLGRLVLGIDGLQTKSSVYVPNAFIELSAYKKEAEYNTREETKNILEQNQIYFDKIVYNNLYFNK